MNLWFRLLRVLIGGLLKPRLSLKDESCLRFKTALSDLDLYGHMNNGRFLTLMDLGRIDLIRRSPLAAVIRDHRWNPLVGSVLMRYRRPLLFGETFELRTRILCWDEKWFYLEQRFEKSGQSAAVGLVKGLFMSPGGAVPVPRVLKECGWSGVSPEIPEKIRRWAEAENLR